MEKLYERESHLSVSDRELVKHDLYPAWGPDGVKEYNELFGN